MKYHYTYLITNLNPTNKERYYIGVHSGSILPQDDIKYMGSSLYLNAIMHDSEIENFEKIIIEKWESRNKALAHEIWLHEEYDVAANTQFYNRSKALNNGFCTYGNKEVILKRTEAIIKCWKNKPQAELNAVAELASKTSSDAWRQRTQSEKDAISKKVASGNKLHWTNKSIKEKEDWSDKFKEIYNNKSQEEKNIIAIRNSKATKGKRWYTNGNVRKRCFLGQEPPGFKLGHKING